MNSIPRIILTTFVISMLSFGMIVLPSYAINYDGKPYPPTVKKNSNTLPTTINQNSKTLPTTINQNSKTLPTTINQNSKTLPLPIQSVKQSSYKGNLDDSKTLSSTTKVLKKNPLPKLP